MRKFILFLLTAAMMIVPACSLAEYHSYQLITDEHPANYIWTFWPLDARNVIVRACSITGNPWRVSWYRDGRLYRELTYSDMDWDEEGQLMPKPAAWDGERLTMSYARRKGEKKYIGDDFLKKVDPANYEPLAAEWTDNGLEHETALPETWDSAWDNGRTNVYRGNNAWTVVNGETETILPFRGDGKESVIACTAAGEDAILMKIGTETSGAFAVRVDHGEERYRAQLPPEEMIDGRIFLPDRLGGFFYMEGYRPGNYTPIHLAHYRADGKADRTLALKGDRVVVNVCASFIGEDGICTLYGSAIAHSRKLYTVFAMTLDEDLSVKKLEVRKIDPQYGEYDPQIYMAPDGTAYVLINEVVGNAGLPSVLIPFSELKKSSKTYGLTLN